MSEPLRVVADEGDRAEFERDSASRLAGRAIDDLAAVKLGIEPQPEQAARREAAHVLARVAETYAMRDLARSNRELAAAMEAVAAEHRARREAGS